MITRKYFYQNSCRFIRFCRIFPFSLIVFLSLVVIIAYCPFILQPTYQSVNEISIKKQGYYQFNIIPLKTSNHENISMGTLGSHLQEMHNQKNPIQDNNSEETKGEHLIRHIVPINPHPPLPDASRPTRQLWTQDGCHNLTVGFTVSQPICALASYPGSGNTWIRYLIEGSTGFFTGSVFDDQNIFLSGFYGELDSWSSGSTLIQKTHSYSSDHIEGFKGRAILLLRNPYRAILAYHNYLFGGHRSYAPVSNYRRRDWSSFVHVQTKAWLETAVQWITKSRSLLVIHYERVEEGMKREVENILQFLGVEKDEQRIDCLITDLQGSFHRHSEYLPENLQIFDNKTRDKIDRAIRYVNYLLHKTGHPECPLQMYEFYNSSTDNFERLPCKDDESRSECDVRVDNLNLEKKVKNHPNMIIPRFNTSIDDTSHPTQSQELHIYGPQFYRTRNESRKEPNRFLRKLQMVRREDDEEQVKPQLKKFAESGVVRWGLQRLSSLVLEDPVPEMLKDTPTRSLMMEAIHFDPSFGPESLQLARDFIWTKKPYNNAL